MGRSVRNGKTVFNSCNCKVKNKDNWYIRGMWKDKWNITCDCCNANWVTNAKYVYDLKNADIYIKIK